MAAGPRACGRYDFHLSRSFFLQRQTFADVNSLTLSGSPVNIVYKMTGS
jgi:hypothetical protein